MCIALVAALAAPAWGQSDDPDVESGGPTGGLLPIPGVLRPPPRADDAPAPVVVGGCKAPPPPFAAGPLPFGPGERLAYDVAVLGVRTGKVRLKMSDLAEVDGVRAYPLLASAKTTGFLSVLGEIDGKIASFLDARTLLPVRSMSQTHTKAPFSGPTHVREDAAFGVDGRAVGRLAWRDPSGEHVQQAKMRATTELVDVLSVVYYVRARALDEGKPFCFELYHRRRLWRIEGTAGPVETVAPPWGARRGRRVDATLRRVGGGKGAPPPRAVTVWVSADGDRLPLLVRTPDRVGDIEVRLTGFTPGRRLSRP